MLSYYSCFVEVELKKSMVLDLTALGRKGTGIENYTYELVRKLKFDDFDLILLVSNQNTKNEFSQFGKVYLYSGKSNLFMNIIWIPYYLLKAKPDVFFAPTFPPSPLCYLSKFFFKTKVIRIVYDAVMWLYPETLPLKNKLYFKPLESLGIRFYDKVLTISDSAKKDITNVYPSLHSRITNIGTAFVAREEPFHDETELNQVTKDPYFLFVGTIDKRKNLEVALEGFALLAKGNTTIRFAIAGRAAWGSNSLKNKIAVLKIEEQVDLLGFVSDDQLASLYKNAAAFVFPSIYEGFGMPVVEAMSLSCPVIASNNSSIPEAAGGAAFLIDDYMEPLRWCDSYRIILNLEKSTRSEMIAKGLDRVKSLSWKNVAARANEVLKKL